MESWIFHISGYTVVSSPKCLFNIWFTAWCSTIPRPFSCCFPHYWAHARADLWPFCLFIMCVAKAEVHLETLNIASTCFKRVCVESVVLVLWSDWQRHILIFSLKSIFTSTSNRKVNVQLISFFSYTRTKRFQWDRTETKIIHQIQDCYICFERLWLYE